MNAHDATTDAPAGVRLRDLLIRLRPYHNRVMGSIMAGAVLAIPVIGWWPLVIAAAAAPVQFVAERAMLRGVRPERAAALVWTVTVLTASAATAVTGGVESPLIPVMLFNCVTLGAAAEGRQLAGGFAFLAGWMLAAFAVGGLDAALAKPGLVVLNLAFAFGATTLSRVAADSERFHRLSASLDPLTGMLNRTALDGRVEELLARARRTGEPVGFILADVDRFKAINDSFGHGAGDGVLRQVAGALRGEMRSFDLVCRIGGDEFLIVLPACDAEAAHAVAERLRLKVAGRRPDGIAVTLSLGVAVDHGPALSHEVLFVAADEALYEAKRAGRNRAHLADGRCHRAA